MKKVFKKEWAIIIGLILVIGVVVSMSVYIIKDTKKNATYTANAVVNAVDYVESTGTNEVYFTLTNGNIYCIKTKDVYDLKEKYILTFDSNGTSSPLDDKIIEIKRPI